MKSGIAVVSQKKKAGTNWIPRVGQDTIDLIASKLKNKDHEQSRVRDSSVSILAKCVPPNDPDRNVTGLVVGYVQSGKTLSFTSVTSLARENNYGIVVVITGTSEPLFRQSRERLRKDLKLDEVRKWAFYENPRVDQVDKFESVLTSWKDPETPDNLKQSILIAVMKHHRHLGHLRDLFEKIGNAALSGIPVLVIDDEADQASLNAKVKKGQETTTYTRMMELRRTLPHHTFLQYTATPQAPLLISLIDTLSPSFVEVLEPGNGYIGGRELFSANRSHVEIIPDTDIPLKGIPVVDPPKTLLDAMRLFFLGTAASMKESGSEGNRSMLVHPSRETIGHSQFVTWVKEVQKLWNAIIADKASQDYTDLMNDFKESYKSLKKTTPTVPTFAALEKYLTHAIRTTVIEEVNASSGKTPPIKWGNHYSWILVGGQAMDRGFTVEGLTVTYMPRPVGVGNADTLQQRGRFFGYKASYLGFCRVFLESDVLDAFVKYVEHEENIRNSLKKYVQTGQPLSGWKRAFLLDPIFKPTRSQVLSMDYLRGAFSDSWFTPKYPSYAEHLAVPNRKSIEAYVKKNKVKFKADKGHPNRTDIQKHQFIDEVLLEDVYKNLIIDLRYNSLDSVKATGLLVQIKAILEKYPKEKVSVYLMSGGKPRVRGVKVEEDKDTKEKVITGEITELFQGANPKDGSLYPGDSKIHHAQNITVQIHKLDLVKEDTRESIAKDVPVVAIWIPQRLRKDWWSQ